MNTFSKLMFTALTVLALSACGGGGGSDDGFSGDNDVIVGVDGILANMKTTNVDGESFPWNTSNNDDVTRGMLKRWDIVNSGLIPLKLKGDAQAIRAADAIESRLGEVIFDRTSIDSVPDDQVQRGIVISRGTAVGPSQGPEENACGHVGTVGGGTARESDFYGADGEINTVLQINLGSDDPNGCTRGVSDNVAIHEYMHALGMGRHFDGFGIGTPANANADNVLYNIHHNETGELEANLNIVKEF